MTVAGSHDARFAPVRDTFAENFTDRGEPGAALCVTVDGRVVVDVWGGSGAGQLRCEVA